MPSDGTKNLKPLNQRSKDVQRQIQEKGRKANAEKWKQKSAAKDVAKMVLSANIPFDSAKGLVTKMGLPETEMNVQAAMLAGAALEGAKGNFQATKFMLDLAGEPQDGASNELDNKYTGLPARVLGFEWVDVNRSIDEREYIQYDFKGGRGSLKSSYCGLKVVDLIMLNERFCGLCVRRVKDNLNDSSFAQVVWAIDELGLTEQFKCTKNPMEIKRKSTGQIIYFRGADEPGKIKSLRPPNDMHIAVMWVEEADQIHGADELRNMMQSAFRGGDEGILFRSYNTPISQLHYINVESRKANPRRLIHHSHFKNAPRRWLGEVFYEIAEELKETNERAYRHEYDGEAIGTGGSVFENVTQREITDAEIDSYDRVYYGLDFGWYPDPNHFGEMYYHAGSRKLYIFGEIRCWKTSNQEMAEKLEKWKTCRITADNASGSSDDKNIADFRAFGFDGFRGAIKGPGSVDYSMKWLQGLSEIIIDPDRCPYTAEEFLIYEYEQTKDGEIVSGYPDSNNHAIDMCRYATEEIWRKRGK